jgi:Tol biopolymer transport system component
MLAWPPDGRQIAFVNGELHVVNGDGSGMCQLTDRAGYSVSRPVWSLDRRWIAFTSQQHSGEVSGPQVFYVVPADSERSKPTKLGGQVLLDVFVWRPVGG